MVQLVAVSVRHKVQHLVRHIPCQSGSSALVGVDAAHLMLCCIGGKPLSMVARRTVRHGCSQLDSHASLHLVVQWTAVHVQVQQLEQEQLQYLLVSFDVMLSVH